MVQLLAQRFSGTVAAGSRTPRRPLRRVAALCALALGVACATSPLGRTQLLLFPDDQMSAMGVAAFDQMKTQLPVSERGSAQRLVHCVSDAITAELRPEETPGSVGDRWEVVVFEDPTPNAFALPGGKIGVHTGLLQVARNQDQLATVIGHEVAHVLARHSNERVSTAYAAQSGIELAGAISGDPSPRQERLMAALGLGAQYGVLLPFGRKQESEADLLGLDLMARAGFDPRESVALWRNMQEAGGDQPPEFLSTHPSHGRRIQDLEARIPPAMELRAQARAAGRRPACDG